MGAAAKKIGFHAVRIINSIINFTVIVIVLLLVAFSCYALWDSDQVHNLASAAQYEIYKPTVEDEGESFAQLRAINPEVFAWLTVYGTHIDYPVTQAGDNWKYVSTDAKGGYSASGSIFLDCGNSPDFSDFNSIFYGHHMEKQTMFGELDRFSNESFFNERPYGNLYYEGRDHGLEFFAFLHVDAYDTSVFASAVEGEETQRRYLENLLEKSMHTRDIGVTIDDRIVLLTTCSSGSTNGRDILAARILDELYDDAFITEETGNTGNGRPDRQAGWRTKVPLWGWGLLLALLAALVLAFTLKNIKKHKRRKELTQKVLEADRRRRLGKRAGPGAGREASKNPEDWGE